MAALRLDRLWESVAGIEPLVGLLWLGLAALTLTLLVLMQTRWGQSRPLRKCAVLSLLAHLLLAGYATTVQITSHAARPDDEPVLYVAFVDDQEQWPQPAADPNMRAEAGLWDALPDEASLDNAIPQPEPIAPRPLPAADPLEPQRPTRSEPVELPAAPALDHLAMAETRMPEPDFDLPRPGESTDRTSPRKAAEPIDVPEAQRREPGSPLLPSQPAPDRTETSQEILPARPQVSDPGIPTALLEPLAALPRLESAATTPDPASLLAGQVDQPARPARSEAVAPTAAVADSAARPPDPAYEVPKAADDDASAGRPHPALSSPGGPAGVGQDDPGVSRADATVVMLPQTPREGAGGESRRPSDMYSLRTAPDRAQLAQRHGATAATEEAVQAALKWLVDNQEPDGRWDAVRHGAGRELLVNGHDRQDAGIHTDTGMTGLALLALLASGHTHREGAYRENVGRGLQHLLASQADDGHLGGEATTFAKMYCHAMATCALSEAYGMTGDERLYRPVRRAVAYTIAAQDRSGGGFRYQPGDAGDTSQCGWQLMALKSAELAGIPMPTETRNGVIRYLRSVAVGTSGGLASYRPNEPVSRPMSAEALVCWQFLGMPREHPAGNEAGDYLLGELPGQREANLYYWYYGTLGMYQLQGLHWQRWNEALQAVLLDNQQKSGPQAGSWDPSTVWGGYGGRVYSTAMATLCLEVYYRFLPLYDNAAATVARRR